MTGRKHQILKLMTLINKDMVDTHTTEIYEVILTVRHVTLEFHQFDLHILLALFQASKHTPTDITALLTDNVEGFINIAYLILENLLLHLHSLRYLTELVMGHNDTGIVIILNPAKELYSVSRAEVLLGSIENLVIGECCLIGSGNLGNIGLHGNNHRLIGNAKAMHLMSGHTHDE